jgi:putative RecB family exonuclease
MPWLMWNSPLSARLYTDDGLPTEFMLVGILDLLLMDENDEAVVVDNKTAAQPIAQQTADDDNQMSAYAYLLAANKYVFPTAPVKCRFDVLRKLKTPKLEHVHTTRTAQDRRRFAKIANAVLAGIDSGNYYPQPGWMCSDCSYQTPVKRGEVRR